MSFRPHIQPLGQLLQGRLLSSFDPAQVVSSGLPPRLLDTSSLQGFKQVDFVGYATNPHARRSLPRGEASKRVAAARNLRRSKSAEDQKCAALCNLILPLSPSMTQAHNPNV